MFINLETLCGLALTLIVLYFYLTTRYNFWTRRGVPGPKPTLLFGNNMKSMFGMESLPQLLTRIYNDFKSEPVIGIFLRTVPVLMVKDPDLIKDILIKDFSKFANRGFFKSEPAVPLSNHLFALEAKRWRPLRTQLSPVFTSGKLRGTFSLILECSNHLESYLNAMIEKGDPIDVRELAARFTTDVIGSCAFGIEMNSLSENESDFRRIGKQIFSTGFWKIFRTRIQQILPPLHVFLARVLPYNEETKMIMGITKETIEYREKNKIVRPDFMNILIELKRHPERVADIKLTDDLLAAQTFIFFAAGFETSSTTISNALYELALNRDIQNKLREEINQFAAKNNGEWKYETIKQMQYLDKVFQETLRKYPALPFLSRESLQDYTFENTKVTIPKGTLIWVPVFPIHRDPEIYLNPEKFDPERFSENKMEERNPMYYLPFGHGPRNCVGARFAIYQTKIGLIKILHKNKVDVCSKTPIPYKYNPLSFILAPTTGLYLTITRLED